MNVVLNPDIHEFVKDQIASGRYASVDEVVTTALDMLAAYEKDRSAFDAELGKRLEALDRGEYVTAEELRDHFRKRGETLRPPSHANAA